MKKNALTLLVALLLAPLALLHAAETKNNGHFTSKPIRFKRKHNENIPARIISGIFF